MIEGDAMSNQLTVWHRSFGNESWQPELTGTWFPDSFGATMGELMDAIAGDGGLTLNGEDNLKTLALVEAAYLSIENRCTVEPSVVTNKIGVLS